jgi:N-acyl-D-amino-acid deacylase
LRDLMPPKGQLADDRMRDITVGDLLHHTAGWGDHAIDDSRLLLLPAAVADYFGMPAPPSSRMLVRYVYSNMTLDTAPGTRYAYSNFGYTLLGRVIEEISGMRYAEYIQRELLGPSGIWRMAISGNSPQTAKPGEVRYYDYPGAELAPSIFPDGPPFLAAPYDMDLQMMDAFGGWAASVVDLVRFSETFDGRRGTALLKPETIQTVMAHDWTLWPDANLWMGLGWVVQPAAGGVVWFHDGGHPGDRSLLVHWPNGISVAVAFNSRPQSADFLGDVIAAINAGLAQVRSWPAHDLFPQYDPPAAQ